MSLYHGSNKAWLDKIIDYIKTTQSVSANANKTQPKGCSSLGPPSIFQPNSIDNQKQPVYAHFIQIQEVFVKSPL